MAKFNPFVNIHAKATRFGLVLFLILLINVAFAQNFNDIEKSPYDDRQYLTTTLSNGLKVVVVSDPKAQTAAAAMMVNVGLYDDPTEFPGLSHFLEHMLFLGTKKFPTPDEFQNLLNANGGSYNAMTQGEATTYFFNVQPQAFTSSLERFADFFIAPLFDKTLIARELNAVDAEFQMRLNQDGFKIYEVGQETSNPAHPFYRSTGGNLETLGKDHAKLYEALLQFYQTHYSAQEMSLALVGPQSTAALLKWAQQYFSAIPAHPIEPRAVRPPLYEKAQRGVDIYIRSQGDLRDMVLIFPLPIKAKETKNKAAGKMLRRLIGDQGPGGLWATLNQKGWVTSLDVNYDEATREEESLSVHFSLTPTGLANVDQITQAFFSYMALLKQKGIPTIYYAETQKLIHWDFLYEEHQEPADYAIYLASNLPLLPRQQLVSFPYLIPSYQEVNHQAQQMINQIIPENMRRFIIDPNPKTDKRSKWFEAPYRVAAILPEKLTFFAQAPLLPQLQLPGKNPFVADEVKIHHHFKLAKKYPQRIDKVNWTLWHHQDTQFKKPYGTILVNLVSPLPLKTAKNALLAQMYVSLAAEGLRQTLYPAAVAGIPLSIHDHSRGITLTTNGYCDKQAEVLLLALEKLRDLPVDENQFNMIKDNILRAVKDYQNLSLMDKAFKDFQVLLFSPAWHPQELLAASNELTIDNLKQFKEEFWQVLQMEMLVSGNFTEKKAIEIGRQVAKKVALKNHPTPIQRARVIKLDKNTPVLHTVSSLDKNQFAIWYLQNPTRDLSTIGKTLLLSKLLEGPFYQKLRVEQQLGYALNANAWITNQVSGLIFWVQSPSKTSTELLQKMHSFLQEQQQQIAQLTEKELAPYRQALITEILEEASSQQEQTFQWWNNIESGEPEFDRNEKLAKIIKQITAQDLIAFSQHFLMAKPDLGQLLIVTQTQKSTPTELTSASHLAALEKIKAMATFFEDKEKAR